MSRKILAIVIGCCLAIASGVNAEEKLQVQSSASLVINAWEFFAKEDYRRAILYSDECIRRFNDQAAKMQSQLDDYPTGANADIHAYYALNDVATAYYIKAESLRKLDKLDEAQSVYQNLIDNYSFGQCWDPRGWFWQPAVVAREKLHMIKTGDFYDFGDYSSMTLMVLAWKALDEGDIEAILNYTNKCIELYSKEAKEMQSQLNALPKGNQEQINSYWALNDVATAYFIQGEAFFKNDQLDNARVAYQSVLDHYSFAQCWDPRGWFWGVADGAREKIKMIDSGLFMDFWDYSSSDLMSKAWQSFADEDYPRVLGYANKCIELYSKDAKQMQSQLAELPKGTPEQIHAYWALNDVATAHYLKGKVYFKQKKFEEAKYEFERILSDYSFGQCWDPNGWWWQPAREANQLLQTIYRY